MKDLTQAGTAISPAGRFPASPPLPCHARKEGSTKRQHRSSSSSLGQGEGPSAPGSIFGQRRAPGCRCARREQAHPTASQRYSHSLADFLVQGLSELQVASLDFSSMNLQSFSEMAYLFSASTILQRGVPQLSFALHKGTSLIVLACVPTVLFGGLQVLHGKRL